MSIEDEARAEAERRYLPHRPVGYSEHLTHRKHFIAGAEWQASRKPEAAPSDTDHKAIVHVLFDQMPDTWDEGDIGILADAILEAGFSRSQPVQVEPEQGYERCKNCGERMWAGQRVKRNAEGAVIEHQNCAHPYHPAAQPVQVEVTDEMVEKAAQAFGGLTVTRWSSTEEWERNAVRSSMRRALSAALTPPPAVPAPEVIPGTRAALDGLSIRTGGGGDHAE